MRITAAEIPPEWKHEIEEIAQSTGRTSRDIVREALAQYLSETDPLTGQLVNANWISYKYIKVVLYSALNNSANFIHNNLERANKYAQELLQLIQIYTKYYSSPVPEIQEYAEKIDLEFLVEDLPKILISLKLATERICQIFQSYQSSSDYCNINEVQVEVEKEALAQCLGKTDYLTAQLVNPETIISEEPNPARTWSRKICNPVCFISGNLMYLNEDIQCLLQLLHLYAKYYFPPKPEIHQYVEAINLEFLVQNLPKLLNSIKIENDRMIQVVKTLPTIVRSNTATINLHEFLDLILLSWQPRLRTTAHHTGIQLIKEYSSVLPMRWPVVQVTSVLLTVLMNVLILAIHSLEESTGSKIESIGGKFNLASPDSALKPILQIGTHVNDRNQVIVQIGDYSVQFYLDSEQRLHAEAEPAIKWGNGYGLYVYHGVILPEKYGKLPTREWQGQWILSENNAELRRVLIQGIGYARICTNLQATELDSWAEYSLLKIDQLIDIDREPIYLLKMTCPSTGFIHTLRVPPNMLSAREAIAWVNWGVAPLEFSVQT